MDETDRRDRAEARLFALYEADFAELEERICRLDPGHSPGSSNSLWPRKLPWEDFRDYLRRRSVRDPEIRRCWVERLVLRADPQEQAALRDALDPALLDAGHQPPSHVDRDDIEASSVREPHFLAKRHQEPSRDGG